MLLLITILTGCNLSTRKTDYKTEYLHGKQLEDSAYTMTLTKNVDPAINYLKKSLAIYKKLVKTVDSTKDTLYVNRLLTVNGELGGLYFAKGDFENAITHFSEGFKWARLLHLAHMQEFEVEMMGHSYLELGHTQLNHDDMHRLTLTGLQYINEACNIIDSLKVDTVRLADFTGVYSLAVNLNATFGDTAKANYYYSKYISIRQNATAK